jgi:serine kinase of HPr protein (carbohydrate metabolism regulator)
MTSPTLSSETLHVSTVAKNGMAILISGRSGSGKSDLTLRLIDRGAALVSDDYTLIKKVGGRLIATAPANIAGKLEVRNLGILDFEHERDVAVSLFVDLDRPVERQPDMDETFVLLGVKLPVIAVSGFESSAPVKVELALERFGLKA